MPSVRPRSSRPVNCERFHSPRRIDASAAAVRRATPYSSARVCSAAAMVLPVGALTTVMPARVAASRSTLSTPTPARPMTTSRVPAAISSASTWTWLRTMSASYSGRIAHSSSRLQPDALVDLVVGAEELDALGGDGLGDEDLHAPAAAAWTATPVGLEGGDLGGARRPSPGATDRPIPSDTNSSVLIAPRISSIVTDPRWPRRKILPVSLPWPPARTTPRRLTSPLNAFQSRSVGHVRGGDRLRGDGRVREELEAEGGQAGAGRGGAGLVAGEDARPCPPRPSGAGPRRPGRPRRSPG